MIDFKPKIKTVSFPDGETVCIKQFTVKTRQQHLMGTDEADLQGRLICFSLCDEAGTLLYGPDDVHQFLDLPVVLADVLIKEICLLNGLNVDAKKKE